MQWPPPPVPGITDEELHQLLQEAQHDVDPDEDVSGIEVRTRRLDEAELRELHNWLVALPGFNWVDTDEVLDHLLATNGAIMTFYPHMQKEALFAKLKWG